FAGTTPASSRRRIPPRSGASSAASERVVHTGLAEALHRRGALAIVDGQGVAGISVGARGGHRAGGVEATLSSTTTRTLSWWGLRGTGIERHRSDRPLTRQHRRKSCPPTR